MSGGGGGSDEHEATVQAFLSKMSAEGLGPAALADFRFALSTLLSGSTGSMPEASLQPVEALPSYEADVAAVGESKAGEDEGGAALLGETVVVKLNGGLGTGMGLDTAKSLLPVKGARETFLDLTARQILQLREESGQNVRFVLMNSFSTSEDTLDFLTARYPQLVGSRAQAQKNIEMLQNKAPKVDAATMQPVEWELNPAMEWCPRGHGDLYTALYGSGTLQRLVREEGIKYMFVSNSDNLGATMDVKLLEYFASSGKPFLMECCERTESDKKGGHLAVRASDGQLVLRESAQCPDEDEQHFQDVTRHRFFNTNNLWLRLDRLLEVMEANGGFLGLPMIKNAKTVDPTDSTSTKVIQLETAMGAAIECFEGAGAIVVPRTRFAPVKKCNDLFVLRSDAYSIDPADNRPVLAASRNNIPPVVKLDSKAHKFVGQLDEATALGVPSLIACDRLTVTGNVRFSSRNIFQGDVTVTVRAAADDGAGYNGEPVLVPAGTYKDTTIELTVEEHGLGPLRSVTVPTNPIAGQKPGTSGLRKKTAVFIEGHYLHNFVQSVFDTLKAQSGTDVSTGTLLVGGDGRYYNPEAIQVILKIAVANGVRSIWVGQDGLLSTPAVSAVVRERGPTWRRAFGSFILTASHNPGGPEEDFGIKYNCENGGPAPTTFTDAVYARTKTITSFKIAEDLPTVDLSQAGAESTQLFTSNNGQDQLSIQVIDATEDHVNLLKTIFDFAQIRALIQRPDFSMAYDSMSGVQGPYARRVFIDELGCPESALLNAEPKNDFGGIHADPNLTYARQVCDVMGVDRVGLPIVNSDEDAAEPPCFGAAADGDADRNMILGRRFFVTPSDSLAIITAHAHIIPYFARQGGLKAVARSMPTSGAVDLVARRLNLHLFETPTGWKYFGNVMDSRELGGDNFNPMICGEESFGTGSDHVREKDGMWAVLCWLSILAHYNSDASQEFVHVEDIVRRHWAEYGRNYYCRYDYEGVDSDKAQALMAHLRSSGEALTGTSHTANGSTYEIAKVDEFSYLDPVDGSLATGQGIRILFADGSRVVFRLSGTAGSGATIRMYLEKYEPDTALVDGVTAEALGPLVTIALQLSRMSEITGRESPTVIT